VARKYYIRLTLPTWLPDSLAAKNRSSIITDLSGVSYGYCNNIGFQMLEKIQFFQDQVLLQELYGEYLDWRLRQMNSIATTYVIAQGVGTRGESALDVQRSATPGLLRIPIPLIGWEAIGDSGFPMIAMRQQRFRIRILLRRLEDVVVASDGHAKPQPWNIPLRVQLTQNGPIDTSSYRTLPNSSMAKGIGIALESTQVYVPRDVQEWFKIQKWEIPFRRAQLQEFTVEDNQWNAAATSSVTSFSLPFRLDFVGAVSRLLTGFQTQGARLAGQRTFLLENPIRAMRLNIANIDRVQSFSEQVFREVNAYWKNIRSSQDLANLNQFQNVFTVTFGARENKYPAGTLNFTSSTQPELWVTLNSVPIDPRTLTRRAYLICYVESWNIWQIQNGKGITSVDE
jgi:hypothetical protein